MSEELKNEKVQELISQLEKLDDNSKILVKTYASALADRERMESQKAYEEARKIVEAR